MAVRKNKGAKTVSVQILAPAEGTVEDRESWLSPDEIALIEILKRSREDIAEGDAS